MHDQIRTLLLHHKNKRIALHDMDILLKDAGIHLFTDTEQQKQFIRTVQNLIKAGVLVPLKSARPLIEYGGLPAKYTLRRDLLTEEEAPLSAEHRSELFSLPTPISIDYYAHHADDYRRDRDAILRIRDMIEDDDDEVLTVNERSYEIFGDEKAIDAPRHAAVDGEAVLRNLGLTLGDIRAKKVYEPFFYFEKDFGALEGTTERTVLIVENKDTFWTMQQAVTAGEVDGINLVIYGEGNAIQKKFEYIETVGGTLDDRYVYFGDIDREGIAIFNRLQARYPNYGIRPATSLYTAVLKKAGYRNARPLRNDQKRGQISLSPFIDAFDDESRAAIEWIITEERYLPQEVLTAVDLRRMKACGLSKTL
ncbi:hypothetical protein J2129_000862 [Methanofollis sp. W23]|uniref:Wadjet anti-phage system protein JetD domain-containing protein n=1 Tax=Methanofollis sp. W23 TaxID=2817849 RepID=UPI001AE46865|nr:Wadjet anti-phage system protein JetD domain-containing protein [Methanofollis sp. W23]MBP2145408.1 hypothetical protein [Methanofollis sp. W23]